MSTITVLTDYARDDNFLYMLLSRLQMDCNYYVGYGGRVSKHLWAGEEKLHINEMKGIHNYLNPKPEWLTMEEINELEKKMIDNKD